MNFRNVKVERQINMIGSGMLLNCIRIGHSGRGVNPFQKGLDADVQIWSVSARHVWIIWLHTQQDQLSVRFQVAQGPASVSLFKLLKMFSFFFLQSFNVEQFKLRMVLSKGFHRPNSECKSNTRFRPKCDTLRCS